MMASSRYEAFAAISVNAAYSPADALLKKLATNPWNGVSPAAFAAMPSVNETTK